jgi:acyl carrier protein phosphodiesterase
LVPILIISANVLEICHNVSFMNFLAHLLLSGENEGVMIGNYAGDFVKGFLTEEKTKNWDKDYLLGVKLHRFIDAFTDTHAVVRDTKRTVSSVHGKLGGIVVDVYFDYFLARNFEQFSTIPLTEYAQNVYRMLSENEQMVPSSVAQMAKVMIRQDWLNAYTTLEGMELTFNRLAGRAPFLASISNAAVELRTNEVYYKHQFEEFFPELQLRAERFIRENQI